MSKRDRRAIALGACVILFSWLALSLAPELVGSAKATEERLEQQLGLLSRSLDRVAGTGELSDSVSRFEDAASRVSETVLAGSDARTASVGLMRRVSAVIEGRGTLEGFEEGERSRASGALRMVSLVARFETDFQGLLDFVSAIERDPTLATEAIVVRTETPEDSRVAGDVERLRIEAEVSAWYVTDAPSSTPRTSDR